MLAKLQVLRPAKVERCQRVELGGVLNRMAGNMLGLRPRLPRGIDKLVASCYLGLVKFTLLMG